MKTAQLEMTCGKCWRTATVAARFEDVEERFYYCARCADEFVNNTHGYTVKLSKITAKNRRVSAVNIISVFVDSGEYDVAIEWCEKAAAYGRNTEWRAKATTVAEHIKAVKAAGKGGREYHDYVQQSIYLNLIAHNV